MDSRRKKIIGVVITLIFLLLIPLGYFGFQVVNDFRSGANTEFPPKNIQVFNQVSNAVDIAWNTDGISEGYVMYGPSEVDLTLEARDVRGGDYTGLSHLVTIGGLEPNTTYYYKIISGIAESAVQSFVTSKVVSSEPVSLFGTADLSNADNIIRAFLIEKGSGSEASSTKLGTVVLDNGSWTMDAGNLRTSSGDKVTSLTNYLLQIEIVDKGNIVVSREIVADFTSERAVALKLGQIDDPSTEAKKYTDATARVTPTSTSPDSTGGGGSVGGGNTGTGGGSSGGGNASSSIVASNLQIVNIQDGAFAVLWETDIPTNSYVEYSINGSGTNKAFDIRSDESLSRSLRTHLVPIVDTTNAEGTPYQITLINNGQRHSQTLLWNKVNLAEVPSSDFITVNYEQTGNYLDQVLLIDVPNQSTKVAVASSIPGKARVDLSGLRSISNPANKYEVTSSTRFNFTLLGGTLSNESELEAKTYSEVSSGGITIASAPKDQSNFEIYYINIVNGQIIYSLQPQFSGEGFNPNSNLNIEIIKN